MEYAICGLVTRRHTRTQHMAQDIEMCVRALRLSCTILCLVASKTEGSRVLHTTPDKRMQTQPCSVTLCSHTPVVVLVLVAEERLVLRHATRDEVIGGRVLRVQVHQRHAHGMCHFECSAPTTHKQYIMYACIRTTTASLPTCRTGRTCAAAPATSPTPTEAHSSTRLC